MMIHVMQLLAQIDQAKLEANEPRLDVAASSVMTWLIAGVLAVGILAITFKTSKRNHLEND